MSYLVFDIGGTNSRVALTDDFVTLENIKSFATPKSFKAGLAALTKVIDEMKPTTPITAMAGGIRGMLMEDKSGIENDGILSGWARQPLKSLLHKTYNVPVYLENDTALAGLGEAVYGAGKGMDIIAYHTVSTGVGGVKIERGQIDDATSWFEPGHQVLDIDRTILGDDITPTLENLVSWTGLEARVGMKPREIPQEDTIWDELAEYWAQEVIVLGGSMILGDPKIPIEAVRKYTVEVLDGFVECPYITIGSLGDEAGLYGAMEYLKQKEGK